MPERQPPEAPEEKRQADDVPAGDAERGRGAVRGLLPSAVLLPAE